MLWNPKVHCGVHNSPPLLPSLSQINSVYTTLFYLFNIHHSNIYLSKFWSSLYPCGVHPVALCVRIPFKYTCDRNWEFIGVTFFSLFTTCFGPYGPSSGEIQLHHLHILKKPSILQRIRCFTICLLLSILLYIQWSSYWSLSSWLSYQLPTSIPLIHNSCYKTNKQTPWSESASELYRPSDHRLSAKWLPTFADEGCHVVSVTNSYGRILGFLDKSRYFSIK
jgi:hypothetical protein